MDNNSLYIKKKNMEAHLKIKHLAPYLPYGLKCQYEGIVNGGEISKKRKEYKKENEPFVNWSYFRDIDEIKGLKIAPLKSIRVYKKYWVATCGIYNKGQKGFYSGIGIKPILRPLSDLTKEIGFNGEDVKLYDLMTDYTKVYWNDIDPMDMPYNDVQILLKYHFDIFGLIEQNLAIDINTLNP